MGQQGTVLPVGAPKVTLGDLPARGETQAEQLPAECLVFCGVLRIYANGQETLEGPLRYFSCFFHL